MLKGANLNSLWGVGIELVIKNPSVYAIKSLFAQLLNQWKDDPGVMRNILRFDLPKTLKMTFFTVEELNAELAKQGYSYRAIREMRFTDHSAAWCAPSGYGTLKNAAMTVYTDSNLKRYVRLGNGQLFECTNADLVALPMREKENLSAYLTGLID